MRESGKFPKEQSFFIMNQALTVLLIAELSSWAFRREHRNRIKREARGYCQDCGTYAGDKLIAAHLNHSTNCPDNNGVARCMYCETEYHLKHAKYPQDIGMTQRNNDSVVYGHIHQLEKKERAKLIRMFPENWNEILRRLDKSE